MSHAVADPPVVEFGHVEHVTVHFDDLDALGILHNARYAVLLERAVTPYWAERGHGFRGRDSSPDVFHAVREFTIRYRAPIAAVGPVAVHFWLEQLGTTSASYAFEFRSVDGSTVYAEGTRAVVRLDPATLRPAPWSDAARAVATSLLRPA
ncbi:acyl-CoA thioesterase [Micromonospora auratinigra]|uniref:Acyl-CoA thioester hydrolase n=1 Tax=Micromonospora auratinigra TaxID=261654 RepID=A0A1A8ZZA6_9ACTN|nr:thioesterase family protein [Micromonospora auratinigra]SBT49272.1 acyl-CoA thioester hydrolase [Micromonospora auratinigra]